MRPRRAARFIRESPGMLGFRSRVSQSLAEGLCSASARTMKSEMPRVEVTDTRMSVSGMKGDGFGGGEAGHTFSDQPAREV